MKVDDEARLKNELLSYANIGTTRIHIDGIVHKSAYILGLLDNPEYFAHRTKITMELSRIFKLESKLERLVKRMESLVAEHDMLLVLLENA